MRKLLIVLAAVAMPVVSHAQGGFTLGLRLGFAPPAGDLGGSMKMSDVAGTQIPFQVDAMWRINPEFAVGGYFSYGFGGVAGAAKDICNAYNEDCSTSTVRAGIQGTYTFTMVQKFVPWVGVGTGYEALSVKESISGYGTATTDFTGWEYLNLQVGGDYKFSPLFALGPYIQYSMGEYSKAESSTITDKSMHQWFNIGVRGKFDFGAK